MHVNSMLRFPVYNVFLFVFSGFHERSRTACEHVYEKKNVQINIPNMTTDQSVAQSSLLVSFMSEQEKSALVAELYSECWFAIKGRPLCCVCCFINRSCRGHGDLCCKM